MSRPTTDPKKKSAAQAAADAEAELAGRKKFREFASQIVSFQAMRDAECVALRETEEMKAFLDELMQTSGGLELDKLLDKLREFHGLRARVHDIYNRSVEVRKITPLIFPHLSVQAGIVTDIIARIRDMVNSKRLTPEQIGPTVREELGKVDLADGSLMTFARRLDEAILSMRQQVALVDDLVPLPESAKETRKFYHEKMSAAKTEDELLSVRREFADYCDRESCTRWELAKTKRPDMEENEARVALVAQLQKELAAAYSKLATLEHIGEKLADIDERSQSLETRLSEILEHGGASSAAAVAAAAAAAAAASDEESDTSEEDEEAALERKMTEVFESRVADILGSAVTRIDTQKTRDTLPVASADGIFEELRRPPVATGQELGLELEATQDLQ